MRAFGLFWPILDYLGLFWTDLLVVNQASMHLQQFRTGLSFPWLLMHLLMQADVPGGPL